MIVHDRGNPASRTANAIWQWAKVRRSTVLIDELPSSDVWTVKLTFITFACKNQSFVVDWSRRVFTGEKVNWPAAYSWITLDSRYMAKISAAAYLRTRLISEYIRYVKPCQWVLFSFWGCFKTIVIAIVSTFNVIEIDHVACNRNRLHLWCNRPMYDPHLVRWRTKCC